MAESVMSLLQQINDTNQAKVTETQQVEQTAQDEAGKPNAVQQAKDKRGQHSAMMAQTPDEPIAEEAPTPEEQEEFSQLEMKIAELVNGEKAQQIFSIIKAATDPVEGIGQAASDIIKLIQSENPNISEDVLFGLGESAIEQVVQAYEDVDPNVNINEDQMAEALSIGVQEWTQENSDSLDPEMKQYLAGAAPDQI